MAATVVIAPTKNDHSKASFPQTMMGVTMNDTKRGAYVTAVTISLNRCFLNNTSLMKYPTPIVTIDGDNKINTFLSVCDSRKLKFTRTTHVTIAKSSIRLAIEYTIAEVCFFILPPPF